MIIEKTEKQTGLGLYRETEWKHFFSSFSLGFCKQMGDARSFLRKQEGGREDKQA